MCVQAKFRDCRISDKLINIGFGFYYIPTLPNLLSTNVLIIKKYLKETDRFKKNNKILQYMQSKRDIFILF